MKRLMVLFFISMEYLWSGAGVAPVDQNAPVAKVVYSPGNKLYISIGGGAESISSYLYGIDTVYSGIGIVGYNYNKFISLEARVSMRIKDGKQLRHDYSYGLFLKSKFALNEKMTIFGLIGYARTKISFPNEEEFNGVINNYTTQNDISYGAGIDYKIGTNWSLVFDIVSLIDKSTSKPDGEFAANVKQIRMGLQYSF